MNHDRSYVFTTVLARHLAIDPVAIEPTQDLETDWGLDTVDLVLLAQRFALMGGARVPLEELVALRTVGELEHVLVGATPPRDRNLEIDPADIGSASGPELARRRARRPRRTLMRRELRRGAPGTRRA